jgi:tetratricopeptide (TPR) repeat protein
VRFSDQPISLLICLTLGIAGNLACAALSGSKAEVKPVRISDLGEGGDPARRASLRLVDDGLSADAQGEPARAQARYERALQVDVGNPYAYLAIARHHIEEQDPLRALQFLDRADSLLRMSGDLPPDVSVHLLGLRGGALYDSGQMEEGVELLDRAREISPEIWGDGTLSAEELR